MGDARRRLTAAVTLRSLGNRRMHAQRESKTGAGCDGSTTPFLGRNVRGYVDQVSSHRLDQQIKPRRYHAPDANALQGAPRGSADRASIINHTVRHHLDRRRAEALTQLVLGKTPMMAVRKRVWDEVMSNVEERHPGRPGEGPPPPKGSPGTGRGGWRRRMCIPNPF